MSGSDESSSACSQEEWDNELMFIAKEHLIILNKSQIPSMKTKKEEYPEKIKKSKHRKAAHIIINKNAYAINQKLIDRTVWLCTEYRRKKCKARVTTMKNTAVINDVHTHDPNYLNEDLSSLPSQIVNIYSRKPNSGKIQYT
ncbi:hypothetical protein JTB14_000796 [Gonioctena quinquepunctata]|nr:hypothetical protein JTB14_000796 [Gonioctena quinquepunctata]